MQYIIQYIIQYIMFKLGWDCTSHKHMYLEHNMIIYHYVYDWRLFITNKIPFRIGSVVKNQLFLIDYSSIHVHEAICKLFRLHWNLTAWEIREINCFKSTIKSDNTLSYCVICQHLRKWKMREMSAIFCSMV